MPAKSIATLRAEFEAVNRDYITTQNAGDNVEIMRMAKVWTKAYNALKKIEILAKQQDEEEYRFQLALLEAKMAKDAETEIVYESCVSPSGREYKVRAAE